MPKRSITYVSGGHSERIVFAKKQGMNCPFCRTETLWLDTNIGPSDQGEELALNAYLCESCGKYLSICVVNANSDGSNEQNVKALRAAPTLEE